MIGFVGGTGLEGRGLAFRMALLGEKCLLGSRNPDRATSYKDELVEMDENINGLVEIGSNRDVAELCDLIFITIPYNAVRSVLFEIKDQLAGKIVISTVVPLGFSNNGNIGNKLNKDGNLEDIARFICAFSISEFKCSKIVIKNSCLR